MTTRRRFLASLAAVGAVPRMGWGAAGHPDYLAAARLPGGSFALVGLDVGGAETFRVPLPARGHAGAGHPTRAEAVAFARRPGGFALVIDCAAGQVRHQLTPPAGRQFNGHGVYAMGGALLLTSEQMSGDSAGVIGLWDVAAGYRRRGELSSHGIGPHDLRLMPDGATLVVANGGIATDPANRRKLNIPTMRPNLCYLSIDGTVQQQVDLAPDLHRNSIRHLAVAPDGQVAFAMQWQGEDRDIAAPLLGLHRLGAAPVLCQSPTAETLAMKGYAGSVAWSPEGFAITSPRGGRVQRFDTGGRFVGALARADVCGLAPRDGGYLASDGLGGLIAIETDQDTGNGTGATALRRHACAWDNHIVTL